MLDQSDKLCRDLERVALGVLRGVVHDGSGEPDALCLRRRLHQGIVEGQRDGVGPHHGDHLKHFASRVGCVDQLWK